MEIDKIYNMDCLEGLKLIQDNSIDLIVTDPPYEFVKCVGGGKTELSKRTKKRNMSIDFISHDFNRDKVFNEFLRVLKIPNLIIFCSNKQLGRTLMWFEDKGLTTTTLVWNKSNPAPLGNMTYISDVEFIVYVRSKGSTFNSDLPLELKHKVYTSSICPDGNAIHPTQKGVDHIRRFIKLHSNEGDVVLDAFMGSGTTAIACIKEKRHFIGFELSKEYYDKANARIKNEQRQLSIF